MHLPSAAVFYTTVAPIRNYFPNLTKTSYGNRRIQLGANVLRRRRNLRRNFLANLHILHETHPNPNHPLRLEIIPRQYSIQSYRQNL